MAVGDEQTLDTQARRMSSSPLRTNSSPWLVTTFQVLGVA